MIGLSVLSAALLAATITLALVIGRSRRERRRALRLLEEPADAPLEAAVQRALRRRVPRDELSSVLFSREAVLDATPTPVLVFDPAGRVQRANAAARILLPAAAMGADARSFAPALAAAIDEVLVGPPILEREIVIDDPVRRTFEAHLRSHPTGETRSAAAVLIDVTAPVDFREARRLFSAAVSHELRTPLARILGLAETLALPQSQAEREALVTQTELEIDNMRRLIDEMLLLAALDRGELATANAASDPGAVAEAVIADRQARRASRDRNLTIDAVRGLQVQVAGRLLEVVLGNLVDNALRHAGPTATVSVTVRGLGGEVEIVVADDGVGIALEHLPHVFERFYRGEASRAGPGTGLGLALVKHIVEAHGGRVHADSVPGVGTTVRLVLPEAATSGA